MIGPRAMRKRVAPTRQSFENIHLYCPLLPRGTRFLPLEQLTPRNVGQLQRVWTSHTGETSGRLISALTYDLSPGHVSDAVIAFALPRQR